MLTKIEDELEIPIIHVHGNHDYYGGSFPNDLGDLITIGGIRFAVATLWTYLDDTGRREAALDYVVCDSEVVSYAHMSKLASANSVLVSLKCLSQASD